MIHRVRCASCRERTSLSRMAVRANDEGTACRAPTAGLRGGLAGFAGMRTLTRAMRIVLALGIAVLLIGLVPGRPASAHPLGNFTVNQYSRIEVGTDTAQLFYVLDLAELPTVADKPLVDPDGNGAIDDAEREAYLDAKLAEIAPRLQLSAGAASLPLHLVERNLAFLPGQAGLETTRLEADLQRRSAGCHRLRGRSATAMTTRPIVSAGARSWSSTAPTFVWMTPPSWPSTSPTSSTRIPNDLLANPLDERSVSVAYHLAPGTPAAQSDAAVVQPGPFGISEWLANIVNGATASTTGVLLALLAAAAWGALHALSPGHGKTVVGAYLVGSRGTPRHALFLGLTVTITHTAGVIALGLIILFASRTIMPEQLYPWLSLASGLLVAVLGLTILRQRLLGLPAFGHHHHEHSHDHDHDHEHDHAHLHSHDHDHAHDHSHEYAHAHGLVHSHGGHTHSHLPPGAAGERLTWRNLLALGVSGGLLPCPSALLALLGAVAVGRAGFGLMVVVAFSLGLAATLTGVGLLFLYAGRMLERRAMAGPWSGLLRYAPAVAAVAVTLSGVMIAARALMDLHRF